MASNELDYLTFRPTGSKVLRRADGRVAILYRVPRHPPIALELDLKAIQVLRADLARAEAFLRQSGGSA